jgi:hypothetical protein
VVVSDGYCYQFRYIWPGETEQRRATSCEVTEPLGWHVGDEVTIYVDPTRPSSCIPVYKISGGLMASAGAGTIVLWGLTILLARKRPRL